MSELKLENASFEGKATNKLPEGAVVLKKDYRVRIEEIENGYLLIKNYDIKYQLGDEINYDYFSKTWYSEDNPMQLNEDFQEDSLADKL